MSELPVSWTMAPLRQLGRWQGGGTPSKAVPEFWKGSIPWISPKDMKSSVVRDSLDHISHAATQASAAKYVPERSILIVARSGILAHSLPVAINAIEVTLNQDLKALTPGVGLCPEFIAYALRANERAILEDCVKDGTTVHSIEIPSLLDFRVPVAPTREQHRIVAKIEELFSELDKAVESLTLARAQLETYRQSLLDAAVDGRFLVWLGKRESPFADADKRRLSDVVEELGQGWSPQCRNHPASSDEAWSVMKTTAIQHLSFNDKENKELPSGLSPRPHLELRPGDLLITRAGPRSRVGVVCLVRQVRPRVMLCDKAYRLRVDEAHMLPEFLELVLNSPRVLWEVEQLKTGISDSGVNLTQAKFLALRVPAPDIDEQRQTLAHLPRVLTNIDQLEREIGTAIAKSNSLRQSILKDAFSGRLVPQDPTDEPATALLARLREERPAPHTGRRKSA